jgi:phi LC3 family holin
VNAVFAVLVILGIVVDPTTDGVGDSERALSYETPYKDLAVEGDEDADG